MDHEIEKIMRRLNQIVKEKYLRVPIKDPSSDGMLLLEFTKIEPEKIRMFYDQAFNGLENMKKQREEFDKRVAVDVKNIKNEIKRLENNEKELKPHYERVKIKEAEGKAIKGVIKEDNSALNKEMQKEGD